MDAGIIFMIQTATNSDTFLTEAINLDGKNVHVNLRNGVYLTGGFRYKNLRFTVGQSKSYSIDDILSIRET